MNTTSDSLQMFVDRLVEEKGLGGLDEEVLMQVKKDLYSRVEDHINNAIISALSEADRDAFSTLLDTAGEEEIQAFCKEHIEDFDNLIASTLLSFRETYVTG